MTTQGADNASCIGSCYCLLLLLGILWTEQGANQLSYVAENPRPDPASNFTRYAPGCVITGHTLETRSSHREIDDDDDDDKGGRRRLSKGCVHCGGRDSEVSTQCTEYYTIQFKFNVDEEWRTRKTGGRALGDAAKDVIPSGNIGAKCVGHQLEDNVPVNKEICCCGNTLTLLASSQMTNTTWCADKFCANSAAPITPPSLIWNSRQWCADKADLTTQFAVGTSVSCWVPVGEFSDEMKTMYQCSTKLSLENVNDGVVCNKMFDPAKDLTLLAVYQASSTVYLGIGIFFLILTVGGPVCFLCLAAVK